jgi:hypothetical protein
LFILAAALFLGDIGRKRFRSGNSTPTQAPNIRPLAAILYQQMN